MSAKYFCDRCGDELTPDRVSGRDQDGRLFGRIDIPGQPPRTLFAQVIVGTDATRNRGDYCNACIATCLRAALNSTDADIVAPPHFVGAPQERVVVPGGRIGLLHIAVPITPEGCTFVTSFGVVPGPGFRIRAFTVYEREAVPPMTDLLLGKSEAFA